MVDEDMDIEAWLTRDAELEMLQHHGTAQLGQGYATTGLDAVRNASSIAGELKQGVGPPRFFTASPFASSEALPRSSTSPDDSTLRASSPLHFDVAAAAAAEFGGGGSDGECSRPSVPLESTLLPRAFSTPANVVAAAPVAATGIFLGGESSRPQRARSAALDADTVAAAAGAAAQGKATSLMPVLPKSSPCSRRGSTIGRGAAARRPARRASASAAQDGSGGSDGDRQPASASGALSPEQLLQQATMLGVTPKRMKRILANRKSAAAAKARKAEYFKELEKEVVVLRKRLAASSGTSDSPGSGGDLSPAAKPRGGASSRSTSRAAAAVAAAATRAKKCGADGSSSPRVLQAAEEQISELQVELERLRVELTAAQKDVWTMAGRVERAESEHLQMGQAMTDLQLQLEGRCAEVRGLRLALQRGEAAAAAAIASAAMAAAAASPFGAFNGADDSGNTNGGGGTASSSPAGRPPSRPPSGGGGCGSARAVTVALGSFVRPAQARGSVSPAVGSPAAGGSPASGSQRQQQRQQQPGQVQRQAPSPLAQQQLPPHQQHQPFMPLGTLIAQRWGGTAAGGDIAGSLCAPAGTDFFASSGRTGSATDSMASSFADPGVLVTGGVSGEGGSGAGGFFDSGRGGIFGSGGSTGVLASLGHEAALSPSALLAELQQQVGVTAALGPSTISAGTGEDPWDNGLRDIAMVEAPQAVQQQPAALRMPKPAAASTAGSGSRRASSDPASSRRSSLGPSSRRPSFDPQQLEPQQPQLPVGSSAAGVAAVSASLSCLEAFGGSGENGSGGPVWRPDAGAGTTGRSQAAAAAGRDSGCASNGAAAGASAFAAPAAAPPSAANLVELEAQHAQQRAQLAAWHQVQWQAAQAAGCSGGGFGGGNAGGQPLSRQGGWTASRDVPSS